MKNRRPPSGITSNAYNPIEIYEARHQKTAISSTWRFQRIIRTRYSGKQYGDSVRYDNYYRKLNEPIKMQELMDRACNGEFFMFVDGKNVRNSKERELIKLLPWVNIDSEGRPCPI